MKLYKNNKYAKKRVAGLMSFVLSCGIMVGCSQDIDISNDKMEDTPIVTMAPVVEEPDYFLDIANDEYVKQEIDELGVVDCDTSFEGGYYYFLHYFDKNNQMKAMITFTYLDFENGEYVTKVYDAFTRVVLFKCHTEPNQGLNVNDENIIYSIPFFEGSTIYDYGSLIDFRNFALNTEPGASTEYVDMYMPSPYMPTKNYYTNLEMAELYVRFVKEQYRVTEEEINLGLDMEEKVKILS